MTNIIGKDGKEYIRESPEDNLFVNEVNGMRLIRRFPKNNNKTIKDLIREYTILVLNKELN